MRFSDLPESERRPIRASYYRQHKKTLTDGVAGEMSSDTLWEYYEHGKAALHKDEVKERIGTAFGIVIFVAFWVGIVALGHHTGKSASNTSSVPASIVQPTNSLPTDNTAANSEASSVPDESDTSSDNCSPNYSPCIPDVSYDLDCADVGERVQVIGTDVYRLDRDGDGVGCESY